MSLFSNEAPSLGLGATVNGFKIPYKKQIVLNLTATSADQQFFIADDTYAVVSVQEVHGTASTSGTLNIEKLTGTQASGAGTAVLTGTISLAGAANTVDKGTVKSDGSQNLVVGDRLGTVIAGTMTSLANCAVVVTLKRI